MYWNWPHFTTYSMPQIRLLSVLCANPTVSHFFCRHLTTSVFAFSSRMHKIGLLYSEPPFLQFSTPSSLDRYKKFRLKISLIVQTLQRDWAFWNPRKLWVVIVLVSISEVSSSITLVMYFQPTSIFLMWHDLSFCLQVWWKGFFEWLVSSRSYW